MENKTFLENPKDKKKKPTKQKKRNLLFKLF